jgi:hypothetical protein
MEMKNPLNDKVEPWVNSNFATLPRRELPVIAEGSKSSKDEQKGSKGNQKEEQAAKTVDKKSSTKTGGQAAKGGEIVVVDEMFLGPNKEYLTAAEFREEVKHGCAYCNDPISERDANDIEWITWGPGTGTVPLCIGCQKPQVYHELGIEDVAGGGKRH